MFLALFFLWCFLVWGEAQGFALGSFGPPEVALEPEEEEEEEDEDPVEDEEDRRALDEEEEDAEDDDDEEDEDEDVMPACCHPSTAFCFFLSRRFCLCFLAFFCKRFASSSRFCPTSFLATSIHRSSRSHSCRHSCTMALSRAHCASSSC